MKKTLITILVIAIVIAIAIGSFFAIKHFTKQTQTPEEVACKYLELIMENDYSQLMSYMDLPEETPFFSTIDIMYQIYNSKYAYAASIINDEYEIQTTVIKWLPSQDDPQSTICRTLLIDKATGSNVTFDFELVNKDNQWKVIDKEFYLDELCVIVPSDAIAVINGKDITGYSYEMYDVSNCLRMYKVPNVGCAEKTIGVKWKDEKEFRTKKVLPIKEDACISFDIIAQGTDEMEQAVMDIWTNVHSAILNNQGPETIQSFLHPNASLETAQRIYDNKNTLIHKIQEHGLDINFKTAQIVDVNVVPYSDVAQTSWLNQDKILFTFNYQLQWQDNNNITHTMYGWDMLLLQKDNDGVYKVLFVYEYAPFWSMMVETDQSHVEMDENLNVVPAPNDGENNETVENESINDDPNNDIIPEHNASDAITDNGTQIEQEDQ